MSLIKTRHLSDPASADPVIYPLSLHDALPICADAEEGHAGLPGHGARQQRLAGAGRADQQHALGDAGAQALVLLGVDRKSTRLNSSHRCISYAVFCLKKKIMISVRT